MSAIHMRQIKAALEGTFDDLVDVPDYAKRTKDEQESAFLTRALAAFALLMVTELTPSDAAQAITDEYGDNGLDAVHYDPNEKILYLVQSKWDADGTGSVSRADVQKFVKGVRDLVAPHFDRFGPRIQAMAQTVNNAISDAGTRIFLILVYTGQQLLHDDVMQDFNDLLSEMNDPSEVLTLKLMRQGDIYAAVTSGVAGAPIDVDVALYEWGQTREPYQAVYGQVAASDVATWWNDHYPRLFSPNIRMFLGDTDVNQSLLATLRTQPDDFWYFNNGVTILCASVTKKAIGSPSRETGIFECKDLRVVNGAQTVGSIAAAAVQHPAEVARARVPVRLISLEGCPDGFDREITRTNNTQNRIERRDFVALDPEQERLKTELQLEEITYVYKSGEAISSGAVGFDLAEAAVARACAQQDVLLAVQAKREVGRLWEDIGKAPYKVLFNASISGLNLWKHVQVLRAVDSALSAQLREAEGRRRMYAIHGNRFVAHLVFRNHPVGGDVDYTALGEEETAGIAAEVADLLVAVPAVVDVLYPDCYLASLFKNYTKCKEIEAKLVNLQDGAEESQGSVGVV